MNVIAFPRCRDPMDQARLEHAIDDFTLCDHRRVVRLLLDLMSMARGKPPLLVAFACLVIAERLLRKVPGLDTTDLLPRLHSLATAIAERITEQKETHLAV